MLVKLLEVPDCFDKVLYKQKDKSLIALTGTCKALRAHPRLRHGLNLRLMYDMDVREANPKYQLAMRLVRMYLQDVPWLPQEPRAQGEAQVMHLLNDSLKCEERIQKLWGEGNVPYHGDPWKAQLKTALEHKFRKLEAAMVKLAVETHTATSTD